MSIELSGQVAVVTGASSGIGLQCVLALLNANASVFGIDISPEPQDLAKYSKFHFHQINLTNPTAAFEAIAVCHEVFGPRIDILQNIAGVMDTYNSADTVSDTMLDRVLNINLVAPIKLMRAVLPTMKEQGSGSIINVASAAGTSGIFAGVAYTASKHGIVGASKNVAWRFKKEGIRCNVVTPGGIFTNIHKSYNLEEVDEDALAIHRTIYGIQDHIEPDKVASVMLFLSSDLSKEVNGAVIPVGNALT